MKCPVCNHPSQVIDSRESPDGDAIRRRRECLKRRCHHRWTTYEREPKPDNTAPMLRMQKEIERVRRELVRFKAAFKWK